MLTNISFELKFSFSNGAMRVVVEDDSSVLLDLNNITEEIIQRSVNVDLPTKLKFILSGKGRSDTKMNGDREIIADKYVLLNALSIGRIPIQTGKLYEICDYTTADDNLKDTFWAYNGQVVINLDEEDYIKWHLKNNNIFDFTPT